MDDKTQVYIKIDDRGRIIRCDGGYGMDNIDNVNEWILIDEGYGDRYNHCQTAYFDRPILDENGVPLYKYENGLAVERTQEEINEDIAAMPEPNPTVAELQARVTELETAIELLVSGATEVTA